MAYSGGCKAFAPEVWQALFSCFVRVLGMMECLFKLKAREVYDEWLRKYTYFHWHTVKGLNCIA